MTEPLDVAIAEAMYARLKATPGLTAPIAAPFVAFTPTAGVAYLDVRPLLTAQSELVGLNFANSSLNSGIFQVDAVAPDGAGQNPGMRLAALVASRFPIGTALSAGGAKLRILKFPNIAAALRDAAWIRFPVSIPYLVII